ncbi:TetR/AcrR family transcriptional regulator [Alkalicoccobacillus plakortidis]|uniref:TetR/AcrR family transcriptional regulator n=1 Tax=Alkalicoccobacillus plakortidis TaxID=444060 RepID=A0ABT0XE96_9BACI|nr:TetR/AcrR family transcriptional regulator [Alkalicoccobacillus plakortidis]MCM2674228.1 TetR/AcrR family transcriptional regulator [Alkalicoccobacillus plakortidis]
MKETIIDSALRLFSNEGYTSTSMQSIAEACGISKASLYKHFESKEDLLIQVFEHSLQRMFQRAQEIAVDETISPKERFTQKIILELEVNQEQRAFVNLIIRAMPIHQNPKVRELMKRTKAALMNWHKICLLEAYGELIRPYIWDIVVVFQGTLREYIVLMMDDYKLMDKSKVAALLVSHLDAIVESTDKPAAILTPSLMNDYERFDLFDKKMSEEEIFNDILTQLVYKKDQSPQNKQNELREAIERLETCFYQGGDQQVFIEALCLYIDARIPIKEEIQRIQHLLKNRKCKEGISK